MGVCPGAVQHEQRMPASTPLYPFEGAAHDALQTRDRTKLRSRVGAGFKPAPTPRVRAWAVRISGAPPRAATCVDDAFSAYALALRRVRDTHPRYENGVPAHDGGPKQRQQI